MSNLTEAEADFASTPVGRAFNAYRDRITGISSGLWTNELGEGFFEGWDAALHAARQVVAGEDTIEWARGATSSSINLAYAIEGLDGLALED